MISAAVFTAILASVFARPSLENITYLHNISLTYDGNGITNLDRLNQMDGVDDGMVTSLKKAILEVFPLYVAETGGTLHDVQYEVNDGQSSDVHSPDMGASPTPQHQASAIMGEGNPISKDNTDEQFWSRDDLVHFLVNLDRITTTSTSTSASTTSGMQDIS